MFALVHVGVSSTFVLALEPCFVRCLVTCALLGVAICSGRQCLTLAHSVHLLRLRVGPLPSLPTLARFLTDDTPPGFVLERTGIERVAESPDKELSHSDKRAFIVAKKNKLVEIFGKKECSRLPAEEDDKQLGSHNAEESGERIDCGVADRGLVVVRRKRFGIRQGRCRRHRTCQQAYYLEVIHLQRLIGYGADNQKRHHGDDKAIQDPHIAAR